MDTLKIKTFLLVEKYKSFSKTADAFSYTPSAVSHIADSLEEELGLKLFQRTRRGVELTEAGKQLYNRFSAVIDAEDSLFEAAAALVEKQDFSLKIGTYSSIALHILPELLQSFKQAYPAVRTTILVDDYMQNWLENGTADIILADETMKLKQWQPFMEDEYVAVVPESIFPERDEVTAEELYAYPFIFPNEDNLDSYLDYSRFREVIPVKSIENHSAVYMVRGRLGVTILPKLTMKTFPAGVRTLRLKPKLSRIIGFAHDPKQPSWACERFVRHIKKYMK